MAVGFGGGRAFEAEGRADFTLSGTDLLQGGRSWDARTGEALDGGPALRPLRVHVVYAFAFEAAWPEAEIARRTEPGAE